jgi:hypothetical protein
MTIVVVDQENSAVKLYVTLADKLSSRTAHHVHIVLGAWPRNGDADLSGFPL